jgi:hypothetical protein
MLDVGFLSLSTFQVGGMHSLYIYIYIYYELPALNVDPYVQDLQLLLLEQLYVCPVNLPILRLGLLPTLIHRAQNCEAPHVGWVSYLTLCVFFSPHHAPQFFCNSQVCSNPDPLIPCRFHKVFKKPSRSDCRPSNWSPTLHGRIQFHRCGCYISDYYHIWTCNLRPN